MPLVTADEGFGPYDRGGKNRDKRQENNEKQSCHRQLLLAKATPGFGPESGRRR